MAYKINKEKANETIVTIQQCKERKTKSVLTHSKMSLLGAQFRHIRDNHYTTNAVGQAVICSFYASQQILTKLHRLLILPNIFIRNKITT
jgi:hypothetical protein